MQRFSDITPARGGWLRPFVPGQSGNPSGTGGPGSSYNIARSICAQATPEAARRQVEMMGSNDDRVAFMAIEAVLSRGAGKPRDHSAEEAQHIEISHLTIDERETLAGLLKKELNVLD